MELQRTPDRVHMVRMTRRLIAQQGGLPDCAQATSRKLYVLCVLLAGLLMAADMLLSEGGMKILVMAVLGSLLDHKADPQLALLDPCVAMMLALLLDCLLHEKNAVFMQGPLMQFLRGTPLD